MKSHFTLLVVLMSACTSAPTARTPAQVADPGIDLNLVFSALPENLMAPARLHRSDIAGLNQKNRFLCLDRERAVTASLDGESLYVIRRGAWYYYPLNLTCKLVPEKPLTQIVSESVRPQD